VAGDQTGDARGDESVPEDACHVGKGSDRYSWVYPDGIDKLTELTVTCWRSPP
jgi:hypothetical protein